MNQPEYILSDEIVHTENGPQDGEYLQVEARLKQLFVELSTLVDILENIRGGVLELEQSLHRD